MSLLLPLALLGLLTLPAIFLLHLLRNRRDELPIPSLRLWQGLQQRRIGGLPRQIPLSGLLLLQLLLAAALTLALARPVSPQTLGQPPHTIYLLDTTTSMAAVDGPNGRPRFEEARQVIRRHLQSLAPGESVAVVSLAPQPEILLSGEAAQSAALLPALEALTPGGTGVNLSAALTLANGLLAPTRPNQIIVLTDGLFPLEPARLPVVLAPATWQFLPPPPAAPPNLALLDVSARRLPDGRHRLFARVVNYGDAPAAATLRLRLDDQPPQESQLRLPAQGDTARSWTLPASARTAALEIVTPDALPPDNRAELFLDNAPVRRVLLLSAAPETMARALAAQPEVELTVRPADSAPLPTADFDLLVFDGWLPDNWPGGNLLIINPPPDAPLLPAGETLASVRPNPAAVSPLLAGADLSGLYFNQVSRLPLPAWAALDLAAAGDEPAPLIFHGSPRPGAEAVVWNFDLARSNLSARLALPLLTANTLNLLLAPAPPAAIAPGQPVTLPANLNVMTPDGHRHFLAEAAVGGSSLFAQTHLPGLYTIVNAANQTVAGFAVHPGSPQESNLGQPVSLEEWAKIAVRPRPVPPPDQVWVEFWPWLAGAALLLLTVEGWLAWRR
jgi:hypothetical protein